MGRSNENFSHFAKIIYLTFIFAFGHIFGELVCSSIIH